MGPGLLSAIVPGLLSAIGPGLLSAIVLGLLSRIMDLDTGGDETEHVCDDIVARPPGHVLGAAKLTLSE